jgi:hypothetical protein
MRTVKGVTRSLVKHAEGDCDSSAKECRSPTGADGDEGAQGRDAVGDRNNVLYQQMRSVPFSESLIVKRSHIHGWGLFTRRDVSVRTYNVLLEVIMRVALCSSKPGQ